MVNHAIWGSEMKEKVRKIKKLSEEGHRIIDSCLLASRNADKPEAILYPCFDLVMSILDEIFVIADDIDRSLQQSLQ